MPNEATPDRRSYRRLPGRRWFSALGRQRLWLADDHVLLVANHYLVEEYLRFYLRDIQAITIQRTGSWVVWAVLLGLAVLVALLVTLAASGAGAVVAWIVLTAVAGLLAANLFLGPSCVCRLRTIVSDRTLGCVCRLRDADRLIEVLAPLVGQAQSQVAPPAPAVPPAPPAAADAPTGSPAGASPQAEPRPAPQPPAPALAPIVHYDARAHGIVFLLLLLAGSFTLMILLPGPLRTIGRVGMLLANVAVLFAATIALVKQRRTDVPSGVRTVVWLAVAFLGVMYLASVVAASVRDATQLHVGLNFSPIYLDLDVGLAWFLCTAVPWVLGLMGLAQIARFRRAAVAAPPARPVGVEDPREAGT